MQLTIKTVFFVLFTVALAAAAAQAQTRYVTEDLTITLRTGPGSDRKIIAMIPSGDAVEIVSSGDEWSQVRYSDKEGYVLTRYLTDRLPPAIALAQLQRKYDDLSTRHKQAQEQLDQISNQNKTLNSELSQTQSDLGKLNKAHETLKSESTEFLKLKARYEKAVKEMKSAKDKYEEIDSAFNKLANNQLNKGLLYGGGLVFLGLVLGFVLKRPKRRSPLM